jgi:hypothetical protein
MDEARSVNCFFEIQLFTLGQAFYDTVGLYKDVVRPGSDALADVEEIIYSCVYARLEVIEQGSKRARAG